MRFILRHITAIIVLAGLGWYHWLVTLAIGAAACSLHLRRRRQAVAASNDAGLLAFPEFAFFDGENA